MKRRFLIATLVVVILITSLFTFAGCREVSYVNRNIQLDADNFKVYRRMTFVNLRTDKILYEAEGYFSLNDSRENGSEIALTFRIGKDEYKIDYFSIDANVAYVIEQIENTSGDPYNWHIYWFVATPKIDTPYND